jgi:hypothetical protein
MAGGWTSLKNTRHTGVIMRTRHVSGISMKVGSQYVCWDSHKAEWYLGKKRNSEIFGMETYLDLVHEREIGDKRAAQAMKLFSPIKLVFIPAEED